jgi:hypothetical protein
MAERTLPLRLLKVAMDAARASGCDRLSFVVEQARYEL